MSDLQNTDNIDEAVKDVKSMTEMQKQLTEQNKQFNEKMDKFLEAQANINKAMVRGNEEEKEVGKFYGFTQAKNEIAQGKTALSPYWDQKTTDRFNQYLNMVYEKDYDGLKKEFGDNVQTSLSNWTPTEFRSEIVRLAYLQSLALQKCTIVPMGRDKVQMPAPTGNYTVSWVSPGGAITDSKMAPGYIELDSAKLAGLALINKEDLNDSAVPIATFIASQMGEDFAKKIDKEVFQGDASGSDQFDGLEYATSVNTITGDVEAAAFSTFLTEAHLLEAVGKLDDRQMAGAEWFMTNSAWNAVRAIEDGASSKIIRLNEAYTYDLLGFPVNRRAEITTTATAERAAAFFGNLKWVYIGDRMDFNIDTSEHYRFANDQVVFRGMQRLAIKVALPDNFARLVFGAAE